MRRSRVVVFCVLLLVANLSYGQRRDAIDLLWQLSDEIVLIKVDNERLTEDVSVVTCWSIVEGEVIEILKGDDKTKPVRFSRAFECDKEVSFENGHKLDVNKEHIVFLISKVVFIKDKNEYKATADDFLAIQPKTNDLLQYLRQKKKVGR